MNDNDEPQQLCDHCGKEIKYIGVGLGTKCYCSYTCLCDHTKSYPIPLLNAYFQGDRTMKTQQDLIKQLDQTLMDIRFASNYALTELQTPDTDPYKVHLLKCALHEIISKAKYTLMELEEKGKL